MIKTQFYGRYIITDPEICHGKPTFRGTRILFADVLEQVADGLSWESIISECLGSISYEAISEASRLSRQAFLENAISSQNENRSFRPLLTAPTWGEPEWG